MSVRPLPTPSDQTPATTFEIAPNLTTFTTLTTFSPKNEAENQTNPVLEPLSFTPSDKRHALAAIRRAYPGNTTVAQCERIRAALSRFNITTFEAMRYLDCYDPRARVMQLRRSGEAIDTHWQAIVTESGDRHRVGMYVLAPTDAKAGAHPKQRQYITIKSIASKPINMPDRASKPLKATHHE